METYIITLSVIMSVKTLVQAFFVVFDSRSEACLNEESIRLARFVSFLVNLGLVIWGISLL